ncbi:hypothetical protein Mapa_002729 [Marchantia paleacea]|nr:hypothetical protein Mapa_002729 [Marchantia paleacea]
MFLSFLLYVQVYRHPQVVNSCKTNQTSAAVRQWVLPLSSFSITIPAAMQGQNIVSRHVGGSAKHPQKSATHSPSSSSSSSRLTNRGYESSRRGILAALARQQLQLPPFSLSLSHYPPRGRSKFCTCSNLLYDQSTEIRCAIYRDYCGSGAESTEGMTPTIFVMVIQ